ncbi:hypothetical protein Btru_008911 [Bulinus truncatus]|nr:hypothetical protein Btru_008911 [Bulinus truncatus]
MVLSTNYKKSDGPRECPREVTNNNSKIVNSVFCSFGCCIGDGGHLWKCCPDPNIVRNPALENWNWCTTFLLIVILFTIIALVLVASCFAAFYSRDNDACHHRHLFRPNFQCDTYDTNQNPFMYATALAPADCTAPTDGRLELSPYTRMQEYRTHQMAPPLNYGQFQSVYYAMVCSNWAAPAFTLEGVQGGCCSVEEAGALKIREIDSCGGGDKIEANRSDQVTACECEGKGDSYTTDSQVKNTLAIPTDGQANNMLPFHTTDDQSLRYIDGYSNVLFWLLSIGGRSWDSHL